MRSLGQISNFKGGSIFGGLTITKTRKKILVNSEVRLTKNLGVDTVNKVSLKSQKSDIIKIASESKRHYKQNSYSIPPKKV